MNILGLFFEMGGRLENRGLTRALWVTRPFGCEDGSRKVRAPQDAVQANGLGR